MGGVNSKIELEVYVKYLRNETFATIVFLIHSYQTTKLKSVKKASTLIYIIH
jgi:hypothetical protein